MKLTLEKLKKYLDVLCKDLEIRGNSKRQFKAQVIDYYDKGFGLKTLREVNCFVDGYLMNSDHIVWDRN